MIDSHSVRDVLKPELLQSARQVIRPQARTPGYWAAAERLSQLWLGGPLRSHPESHIAAGADLGSIIDWLYEESMEAGGQAIPRLVALTQRFQEMARLETAERTLRRLEPEGLGSAATAVDATCVIIALLTTEGAATLSRRGSAELASCWLEAWADAMAQQNLQQQRLCGMGVLARLTPDAWPRCMQALALRPEDLTPRSTSFSEGVEEFLARYGETSAAAVALLGTLPFSALPIEEVEGVLRLCTATPGLLAPMAGLLRLAPDVDFDPAESLNTGVFATAAEQRRGLLEVIVAGGLSKPELDARLREQWARQAPRMRGTLRDIVASRGAEAGTAPASAIIDKLLQTLDVLVSGTWKQG